VIISQYVISWGVSYVPDQQIEEFITDSLAFREFCAMINKKRAEAE
jgi:hypothetical protein